MPVGAKMQGCSGKLLKMLIEKIPKVDKKAGTLALALQFYGVLNWQGDRLNLNFFWVCRNGKQLKAGCYLTKACRQEASVVPALEWSDCMV